MRSALNIGFTLGALIGGLALASDSNAVVRAVPVLTAAILAVNALLITRLPRAAHDDVAAAPTRVLSSGALRNRGFLLMSR